MSSEQKLGAWTVALTFEGGQIVINTVVAPNAESAAALTGVEAGRRNEGSVASIAWVELTPEWLRVALRAVESGQTSGEVVRLASDNLRPHNAAAEQLRQTALQSGPIPDRDPTFAQKLAPEVAQVRTCPVHPWAGHLDGLGCPICTHDSGVA